MNPNCFKKDLEKLHLWHYENCIEFKKIIDHFDWKSLFSKDPDEIFLHTNLFKIRRIVSGEIRINDEIVMESSGTSSNLKSKIYSDRLTRINQQRALIKIVSESLNIDLKNKFNYYVLSKDFSKKEKIFNAKKAAILGFSMFAKNKTFLLDEYGNISEEMIRKMINDQNPYIIFGFTSDLYTKLLNYFKKKKLILESENNFLIHGGGWKKLTGIGIGNDLLKEEIQHYLPKINCKNYYGMIEQTGSIFMECTHGYLHTNDYGDIIVRDNDLKKLCNGREGIIQSISLLPKSYPGHSLLTEDIGIIHGIDNCPCGRKGKFFNIRGRLKKSELRGCSDVY